VEQVDPHRIRRALRVAGQPLVVDVIAHARESALEVRASGAEPTQWLALAERVRTVFDLGADPGEIARALGADPLLRARLRAQPGLRVPGAWDPFELAVRVVLGQQVTVAGATQLAGRVALRFGEPLPAALCEAGGPSRLFPAPATLADAPLEEIGLPRQRASAVRALAAAAADGRLELAPGADPDATRQVLLGLPGIGAWTAELVLLRALGEPDAFPAGDLGLRRALGCDARELGRRAERWRPWRGYAAMLLWTSSPARTDRSSSRRGCIRVEPFQARRGSARGRT
jgi:AraC family transcriptional regulator of adaptative response / DNA-3-methyladenine glycosylase II